MATVTVTYGVTSVDVIRQAILDSDTLVLIPPEVTQDEPTVPCTKIVLGDSAWFSVTFTSAKYVYQFDSFDGWKYNTPYVPITPQYILADQGTSNSGKVISVDEAGTAGPNPFGEFVVANPTLAGTESNLTGLEVQGVKYKVEVPSGVEANPTLVGTEAALTGLEVDGTKYKVEQPTDVVANPTLAGSEATLTGLQVGTTKYKAPAEVTANPPLAGTEAALTGMQVGSRCPVALAVSSTSLRLMQRL